ncbi:3179_t:CDS:2, partial [Ambispora leptoticha]
ESIEVTFLTLTAINRIIVQKETTYFEINGLTLPHVTTSIDDSIFAEGQAYVAISCATSWENLCLLNFDHKYLKCPRAALNEYKRLERIYANGLQNL